VLKNIKINPRTYLTFIKRRELGRRVLGNKDKVALHHPPIKIILNYKLINGQNQDQKINNRNKIPNQNLSLDQEVQNQNNNNSRDIQEYKYKNKRVSKLN
jgi:hypothetical protein